MSAYFFLQYLTIYKLDGFKVGALDYLLKPYNFEEFYTAALKAKEWFDLVAQVRT